MGLLSKDDLDYYLSQLGAYFAIMLRDNPGDSYMELYSHYCAVREHIETLEKTNGWISFKDKPPDKVKEYIACFMDKNGKQYVTSLDTTWRWYLIDPYSDSKITHWMPLPKPPKENSNVEK